MSETNTYHRTDHVLHHITNMSTHITIQIEIIIFQIQNFNPHCFVKKLSLKLLQWSLKLNTKFMPTNQQNHIHPSHNQIANSSKSKIRVPIHNHLFLNDVTKFVLGSPFFSKPFDMYNYIFAGGVFDLVDISNRHWDLFWESSFWVSNWTFRRVFLFLFLFRWMRNRKSERQKSDWITWFVLRDSVWWKSEVFVWCAKRERACKIFQEIVSKLFENFRSKPCTSHCIVTYSFWT